MLVFLLAALVVVALQRFRVFAGKLILVSVVAMATGRFVTEIFRGDERVFVTGGLTLTQVVVLISLAVAAAFLCVPHLRRLWNGTLVPADEMGAFLDRVNECDRQLRGEFAVETRRTSRLRLLGESLLLYVVAACSPLAGIVIFVVAVRRLRTKGHKSELQAFAQRNGIRAWAFFCGVTNLAMALMYLLGPSQLMVEARRVAPTSPETAFSAILVALVLMGLLGITLLIAARALSRALPERFAGLRREGLI
jgi:hypothetical protein